MSTKIHNGLLLRGSLRSVYERLRQLRPEIRDLQERAAVAFLAETACAILDRRAAGLHALKDGHETGAPLHVAWREMMDRQREIVKTGYRDPQVDFEITITLLPAEHVYALFQTEQDTLRDWLLGQEWVERFAYWDNTDRPDDMSEAGWENRRRIWDRLLKDDGSGSSGICGLTFECRSPLIHPDAERIAQAAPAIETRAAGLAKSIVIDRVLRRMGAEQANGKSGAEAANAGIGAPDICAPEISTVLSRISEVTDWMRTHPDGRMAIAQEKNRLMGILPHITPELLTGTPTPDHGRDFEGAQHEEADRESEPLSPAPDP